MILLYKPQGGKVVVGPDEIGCLPDFDNLFLLGIQTKEQRDCLKTFANKIVCVDATHCTNQYGSQLLNLVVPDEFGKGYPVAHFIATRTDEQVLRFFFSAIKDNCSDLVINAVMTDDDYAPWNAIVHVFGIEVKHLLCIWHILRAWSHRLQNLVPDRVKYQYSFHALRAILQCIIIMYFIRKMQKSNIANRYKIIYQYRISNKF